MKNNNTGLDCCIFKYAHIINTVFLNYLEYTRNLRVNRKVTSGTPIRNINTNTTKIININ